MKNLILDANVFLHARFFADIPWNELLGDDVMIVVPEVVLAEIDKAKYAAPTDATKQRARKVATRILDLVDESGSQLVRTGVWLSVKIEPARPQGALALDPNNRDAHVLAECLALGADTSLCTLDSMLKLRAKAQGVNLLRLDEQLHEPVTGTPKREAIESRQPVPKIAVVVRAGGVVLNEGGVVRIQEVRLATSEEVLMRAHEERLAASRGPFHRRSELMDAWHSEFGDDLDEAQRRDHERFLAMQESVAERVKDDEERGREVELRIELLNEGSRPATNLVVEIAPAQPAEMLDVGRLQVPRVTHNLSEHLPPCILRFPRGFADTGSSLTITVHCDELPKPERHQRNFRVERVMVGPFAGESFRA